MKPYLKLIIWSLIGILVIAGCRPQAVSPTRDPAIETAMYIALQTQAMENARAELTQSALLNPSETPTTAPTQTPPEPSATPLPPTPTTIRATNTPVFIPPTFTFTPVFTSTATATPTRTDYNCSVTSSSPSSNTVMRGGTDFDGRWTLRNTGSQTWQQSEVDFVYVSGTKFQTRVDAIDLPADVSNGNSIDLIIDMLAPNDEGNYSATWALRGSIGTFCTVTVSIVVDN